jgi:hypothetical protein
VRETRLALFSITEEARLLTERYGVPVEAEPPHPDGAPR